MNTYTLTEIELQELFKKKAELCAEYLEEGFSDNPRKLLQMVNYAPDPPLPSGAKKEDIPSKESQKQALIDIMEADQRDGMYGVRDNANVNPIWHNGRYRRLASELFSMAADEFSNHGCNDLDPKLLEGWTEPERLQLAIDFENYNVGHLEEFDPNHIFFQDYALMGFFAHLLNIEQEVQECDASKAKSTDEPMAQNTTKEPVIDSEILKEKIVAIIKDCLRIDQNNQVPNYEIAETRLRMAGRMIYRYLKSNSEPVIDWEGLIGKFYEDTGETNSYTSMFFLWLKSNLSNHIK